jgi:hypothetical protein
VVTAQVIREALITHLQMKAINCARDRAFVSGLNDAGYMCEDVFSFIAQPLIAFMWCAVISIITNVRYNPRWN